MNPLIPRELCDSTQTTDNNPLLSLQSPERPQNPDFGGALFATSNPHKIAEYSAILNYQVASFHFEHSDFPIAREMWGWMANGKYLDVACACVRDKAESAYRANKNSPAVVEIMHLFCPGLDGFPGPFIGDLDSEEGRRSLSHLLYRPALNDNSHAAIAVVTLALYSPTHGHQTRHGLTRGEILMYPSGTDGFGWDSIFIPEGSPTRLTFAEMLREEKNAISMRRQAIETLRLHPFLVA